MRAPFFLRVVKGNNPDQPFDALDQIEDEPTPFEDVFAYQLTARPGFCHIRASRGRGGFRAMAEYKLVEKQPDESVMRDNGQWAAWTDANARLAEGII